MERPLLLADNALKLWDACSSVRWLRIKEGGEAIREIEKIILASPVAEKSRPQIGIPIPKEYPVSLDKFLRLALPRKRLADRMKLYRESLRFSMQLGRCYPCSHGESIPFEKVSIPSDSEVNEAIAGHRATGFDEAQFQPCLIALRNFAACEQSENLKRRAKAGAQGLKKKRQNDG